jgi:hypothetical protein
MRLTSEGRFAEQEDFLHAGNPDFRGYDDWIEKHVFRFSGTKRIESQTREDIPRGHLAVVVVTRQPGG